MTFPSLLQSKGGLIMATIREIPGYYYDEERRRYFKIVNGAIPSNSSSPATPSSSSSSSSSSSPSSSQSVSRYHNNSIQAKQRYANHLAKTTTSTNTNKEIKRNKILKIPKLIIKIPIYHHHNYNIYKI